MAEPATRGLRARPPDHRQLLVLIFTAAMMEAGSAKVLDKFATQDDGPNETNVTNTSNISTATSTTSTTLTTTSYIKNVYWQNISCGADYSVGVTVEGTGWKWGFPFSEREKAIIIPGTIFKYMAAGFTHTCSVTREGETYCFGRNHEGQCDPPRGVYFETLSLGEGHTCGLTDRKEVLCWGASSFRRLDVPQYVNKWQAVDVGAFSACALSDLGKILCWGHEAYGRLEVPFDTEGNILWEGVSCGSRHCCGILTTRAVQIKEYREEDNVVCWGDNQLDQLNVPGEVEGRVGVQEKFQQIAAGHMHTCGLTYGRRIWCWGDVWFWGIVSGIPIGYNITYITSGGHHSCAMTVDLTALCWGDNHWWQSDVPVDDRTLPPTILDYHIHPMDIWDYAPFHRITRFDDAWPEPHHTFQWIHMSCFIPEPAEDGTLMLVFTQWAGTKDPYSPHIMRFPSPRYNIPGRWDVNVSAFDLRKWHDQRWGFNAVVSSVTSKLGPDGKTEHRLVDGGRYRIDLTYEDTTDHVPSNHTIQAFDVEYDLVTLPPIIRSPKSGRTKQGLWVDYELLEPMEELTIFMVFTGAAVPGEFARDESSPHEIQLRKVTMLPGNHTVELHLRDTETNIYFERHPNVSRSFQAGFQSAYRELTDRGEYTFQMRAVDRFNNPPAVVEVPKLKYFIDLITEPIQVIRPTRLVNPLFLEYIIPESIDLGTLRIEFVWLQNKPGEPRAKPDLQSPHQFWLRPHAEVHSVPIILKFGTADLFKDIDDMNGFQAQPDVSRFLSKTTPVISYLQPWSEYEIRFSYLDRYRNPRVYTNLTLWTNFTEPDTPSVPFLITATTSTLTVAWTRGQTGGARILNYDLEVREEALVLSDPSAVPESELALEFIQRTVHGQKTNFTTFVGLGSARHFLIRVRAANVLGASNWSEWTTMRTRSTCGDGRAYDGEECDDGNLLEGDGCTPLCKIELGWKCSAELRDDASKCEPGGMDGLRVGDEECDDCNQISGDGCTNGRIEYFWDCEYKGNAGVPIECTDGSITYTSDRCYIICGDGLCHALEACDDGNLIDGDGCSRECTVEPGYECKSEYPNMLTSVCNGICGDGLQRGTEQCDDGNSVVGDGCSNCKIDPGWLCNRVTWNVTTNTSVNCSLHSHLSQTPGFHNVNGICFILNTTQMEEEDCRLTCFNGLIDEGEECDDANMIDYDGCTNCKIDRGWSCELIKNRAEHTAGSYCVPLCGDGYRITKGGRREECDDGNNVALDGCSPDCKVEQGYDCQALIVNGTVQADVCKPVCGDGITRSWETCDDGNTVGKDGCAKDCTVENGWQCSPGIPGQPGVCTVLCGDGIALWPYEDCDDGNIYPNDGCSPTCTVEPGYVCPLIDGTRRSECAPKCGDHILIHPEECDDGGVSSSDGCSTDCKVENGWVCSLAGLCLPICGDAIRIEGEECDDGNLHYGDGCDSSCTIEPNWDCKSYVLSLVSTTSVCKGVCGDGIVYGEEECDDGNLFTGDGCDDSCRVEADFVCCEEELGGASVCKLGGAPCAPSLCGNGVRDAGEECDDGNRNCCDGCSKYCAIEQGWECENYGRPEIPDICLPVCGDGYFVNTEECDDANERASDGCGSNCRVETGYSCVRIHRGSTCNTICGDGLRSVDEQCDDGNSLSFDGCSRNCRVEQGFRCRGGSLLGPDICAPVCSDGIRMDRNYSALLPADTLEECDTGSMLGPGCDPISCKLTQGYTCERIAGVPEETCHPVCGDGNVTLPTEQCDDGNTLAGDGCGPTCQVEALWDCNYDTEKKRSVCSIKCGDGRRHRLESCDDGNDYFGDGCTPSCTQEGEDGGYECLGGTNSLASECRPICGDGLQVHGEDCDDGNKNAFDGCDATCQIEPMFFCTRAPLPFTFVGSLSKCSRTCGDAVLSGKEECDDDVVPDPRGILNQLSLERSQSVLHRRCEHCRLVPGHLCGDGLRGNNGTSSTDSVGEEQCDDGNAAAGDGCSPLCLVETGWRCTPAPVYVVPARGDTCTTVCGDGLVVPGWEECDDGNLFDGDGCSGACRVEPYRFCFINVSTPIADLYGSYCVETTPPSLVTATLDRTYASMRIVFNIGVEPLNDTGTAPATDGKTGTAPATDDITSATFNCSRVLDYELTVKRFGTTAPTCLWLTTHEMLVEFGKDPYLLPGDRVWVKEGVLRRYNFSNDFAMAHSVRADAAYDHILEPRAIISGPQMTSICVDVTSLDSIYSEGHAGRALDLRWTVISALSIETHMYNFTEAKRLQVAVQKQERNRKILFPRTGFVEDEIDLFIDRSLKPGFVYIVGLRVTNLVGLVDSTLHVIYATKDPVPLVTSAIGRSYRRVPALQWTVLAVSVDFPLECFANGQYTIAGQEVTTWSHSLPAPGTPRVDVNAQRAPTTSILALRPGSLAPGRHSIMATLCVDLTERVCNDAILCNFSNASTYYFAPLRTCSSLTFKVGQEGLCGKVVGCPSATAAPARLLAECGSEGSTGAGAEGGAGAVRGRALAAGVPGEPQLAAAARQATLRLISFPQGGEYIPGAPQPPEVEAPLMELLRTVHDPAGNIGYMDVAERIWGGVAMDPNRTAVVAAVLVPSASASEAEAAALAWLRPRVTWRVSGTRLDKAVIPSDPLLGMQELGGSFLTIPPEQASFDATLSIQANMLLDAAPDSSQCDIVGELSASLLLPVNIGPVAGYMELGISALTYLIQATFTQKQWATSAYPLQYRFEMEEADSSARLLLGDWSYATRQRAFFMPRFQKTLVFHGAVRDAIGSESNTSSDPVYLTSSPQRQILFLSEYREGSMRTDEYNKDTVVELLSSALQEAAPYGALAKMQVLQDIAYRALGGRFNPSVKNCSLDCGLHGGCPPASYSQVLVNVTMLVPVDTAAPPSFIAMNVSSNGSGTANSSTVNASNGTLATGAVSLQRVEVLRMVPSFNLTQCVCEPGWIGIRCERSQVEADAQLALTKRSVSEFRAIVNGTETSVGLDVTRGLDTLSWLLSILLRIVEDCRRASLDALEGAAVEAARLMAFAKRSAINKAAEIVTKLLSQVYECMPAEDKPSTPLTAMPSPLNVLDTLGSSSICRTLDGTQTRLCYDLATSVVDLTCPVVPTIPEYLLPVLAANTSSTSAVNASANPSANASAPLPEQHCQADLELGLSDPYPCPCPVPEKLFLGYGRSEDQAPLWETLTLRDEHAIVWRTIAQIFWNHSALAESNGTADGNSVPGQRLSAAAWFAMMEQTLNETSNRELREANIRRKKRNTVHAIRSASELLSDALVLEMVPGETKRLIDSAALSAVAEVSVVSAKSTRNGSSNISTATLELGERARVELDFSRNKYQAAGKPTGSEGGNGTAVVPPPIFGAIGAVLWRGVGGVYSWLDGAIPVRSNVVQLRLFNGGDGSTVRGTRGFSHLRYRFFVAPSPRPGICNLARPPTAALERCCGYQPTLWRAAEEATCRAPPTPVEPPATVAPSPPPPPPPPPPSDLDWKLRNTPASMMQLRGSSIPFDGYFQGILANLTLWVPEHTPVALSSTRVRLRGGDIKLGRICSLSGALSVSVLEGEVLELPTPGGLICNEILRRFGQAALVSDPWRNDMINLLECSGAALSNESLHDGLQTGSITSTTTSTTSFTTGTRATTTPTMTSTTMPSPTTTAGWCNGGSSDETVWCPSGYNEKRQPVYGDVLLEDPHGLVLLNLSAVQVTFGEDSSAVLSILGGRNLTVVSTAHSAFYLFLLQSMLRPPGGPPGGGDWFTDLRLLHSLSRYYEVQREFVPFRPTTTATSTGTATTTTTSSVSTTTTSTTTTTVGSMLTPPAMLLHFIQGAFDDYLDLILEAASANTDPEVAVPARALAAGPFAARAAGAAELLDAWSEATIATGDLSPILHGMEPVAALVNLQDVRPLEELLSELDAAIPPEWDESYWAELPGGPGWLSELVLEAQKGNTTIQEPCVVVSKLDQPLRVTVISAAGLRDADMMPGAGNSDPYVIGEVLGKPVTRFQTPTIQSSSSPVWNHEQLMVGSSTSDSLTFTVYDGDPMKNDDRLGRATLSSTDFLPGGFEGDVLLANTNDGSATLRVKVELTTGVRAVQCTPPSECTLDVVEEFECVAWSIPLMRWVPALGCHIAEGFANEWIPDSGLVEVVCECEEGAIHSAIAIATQRPNLPPKPDRLIIVSRQFPVDWYGKLHRYNVRGAFMVATLFLAAAVHILGACAAELRWRHIGRRVHSRAERSLELKKGLRSAAQRHEEFRRDRMKDLRQWMPEVPRTNVASKAWGAVDTVASQAWGAIANATQPTTELALFSAKSLEHIDEGRGGEHKSLGRMNRALASWQPYRAGVRPRAIDESTASDTKEQVAVATSQPLKITIVGAKNLRAADWLPGMGTSDPYCICEVLGKSQESLRTAVQENTLDPVWDHEGEIQDFNLESKLVFTVYDKDFGKMDDVLGKAVLAGAQFLPGGFDGEVPLAETKGAPAFLRLKIVPGAPVINQAVELDSKEKAFMARMIRQRVAYDKIARLLGVTLKQVQDMATTLEDPDRRDGPLLLEKRHRDRCPCITLAIRALKRAHPGNVWRACLNHHKLFQLTLDTQRWVFSAPERAAVFHMSLWWTAVFQAVTFQADVHFVPGEDPVCGPSGYLTGVCLMYPNTLWMTFLSAFLAAIMSNVTMVVARGRSFTARTRYLVADDAEEAFLRHFLGPYPMLFGAFDEVKARFKNLFCYVRKLFCCCCFCCKRPRLIKLAPLHWLPSLVPLLLLFMAFLVTWHVTRTMFFFSSSIYMHEVTYSEPLGHVEVVVPPAEQVEAAAALEAAAKGTLDLGRIFVPQMQRFMALFVLACVFQILVLDPAVLAVHLIIGEPTIDEAWDISGAKVVRVLEIIMHSCYELCCKPRPRTAERPLEVKDPVDIAFADGDLVALKRFAIQKGLILRVANNMTIEELYYWIKNPDDGDDLDASFPAALHNSGAASTSATFPPSPS